MIIFDHAAVLQNQNLLMNRYAPDYVDYRDEQEKMERGISWEDKVGINVEPRRSPWRTANEDTESANPRVSESQVPATVQNASVIATSGGTGGGSASISNSALIAAITSPEVIQAILNALPVAEFECPA
jgi:hypothetical protein